MNKKVLVAVIVILIIGVAVIFDNNKEKMYLIQYQILL